MLSAGESGQLQETNIVSESYISSTAHAASAQDCVECVRGL